MYGLFDHNTAFKTIILPTSIILGVFIAMSFGMCTFSIILLSIVCAHVFAQWVLADLADRNEKRTPVYRHSIIIVAVCMYIVVAALMLWGVGVYDNAVEVYDRTTTETEEHKIAAMGEDTTFSGNVFCFGTRDYYIVMEETETGGYLKKQYPCSYTLLYESDVPPMTKTIRNYKEDVRNVSNKLFLRHGEELGENVTWKTLDTFVYEIYIPEGTLQKMPSMNVPIN